MSDTSSSKSLRKDAQLNADRVFAAALEVCAERGLEVNLPEVARRAGVGRATVYRSFASRDDLIEAVMRHRLGQLAEAINSGGRRENAADTDAATSLRGLLGTVLEALRTDRLLGDACLLRPELLRHSDGPSAIGRVLRQGHDDRSLAPDITESDLLTLVAGLAHSLTVRGESSPQQWARAADLAARAAAASAAVRT